LVIGYEDRKLKLLSNWVLWLGNGKSSTTKSLRPGNWVF